MDHLACLISSSLEFGQRKGRFTTPHTYRLSNKLVEPINFDSLATPSLSPIPESEVIYTIPAGKPRLSEWAEQPSEGQG